MGEERPGESVYGCFGWREVGNGSRRVLFFSFGRAAGTKGIAHKEQHRVCLFSDANGHEVVQLWKLRRSAVSALSNESNVANTPALLWTSDRMNVGDEGL